MNVKTIKIDKYKATFLTITVGILLQFIYSLLNTGSEISFLISKIDNFIPFVNSKFLSLIYILFSIIVPVNIISLIFKEKRKAIKLIISIILTHIISFIIFFKYPLCQDRSLISQPNLILDYIWMLDNNCNNFPSLHVGIAFSIMLVNKNKYLNLYYFTVILSCLLLKQHSLCDVVMGIFIAVFSNIFINYILKILNVRII